MGYINMKKVSFTKLIALLAFAVLSVLSFTGCIGNGNFTQRSVVKNGDYSRYSEYISTAEEAYLIPGLNEGFIPQGMDVWCERELLLISGYFKSTIYSPSSVIFAIDMNTGEYVNHYLLKDKDGSYYTGHAGGIAVTPKNLFISSGGKLLRIPLSQLRDSEGGEALTVTEKISVPVRASFCNFSEGVLWVGDFRDEESGDYSTPEWRHLSDGTGKIWGAWCVGYHLDECDSEISAQRLVDSSEKFATPDMVLGIEDHIQGFSVTKNRIALSQSYGRKNDSKILIYDNILDTPANSSVKLGDNDVPVWFLSDALTAYTAPPLSEALSVKNGVLYILYESGATYYRSFGAKYPTDRVWSIVIEE